MTSTTQFPPMVPEPSSPPLFSSVCLVHASGDCDRLGMDVLGLLPKGVAGRMRRAGWGIDRLNDLPNPFRPQPLNEDEDEAGPSEIVIASGVSIERFLDVIRDEEKLPCKFILIVRVELPLFLILRTVPSSSMKSHASHMPVR